jgi:hypothetical protein
MLLSTVSPFLLATVHNHTAAIGLAIAGGGAAMFIPALLGYMKRSTASGERLRETTSGQRRGVPLADHQYYQMRWAGRTAGIGVLLIVVGIVWFLVAGA